MVMIMLPVMVMVMVRVRIMVMVMVIVLVLVWYCGNTRSIKPLDEIAAPPLPPKSYPQIQNVLNT